MKQKTILKSQKEIDAVGTLDNGIVARDGTLWAPVPKRKDTYQLVHEEGGPEFLRRLTFVFAKTLAHMPHWYTKRTVENEADYAALWNSIHDHGVWETYASRRYKYWYAGGFRHWAMGQLYNSRDGSINGKWVSKIINRSRAGIQPISAADKERLVQYERWKAGLPNTEEQRWKKPPRKG